MDIYKKCQDCNKEFKGKSSRCRSCAAKLFRKKLREDPDKFRKFSEKVSNNMKQQWKDDDWADPIRQKISNTNKQNNSKLTKKQLKQKYGNHAINQKSIDTLIGYVKSDSFISPRKGKTNSKDHNKKISDGNILAYAEGRRKIPNSSWDNVMKGYFKCKNPEKYAGDSKNIVYRSSYELKLFQWLDNNEQVESWASEEFSIRYLSPKDNKLHSYYPDVLIRLKDGRTILVEVKPAIQCVPPNLPKDNRGKKRYITEVMTYGINKAKWAAAENYCEDRGWEFKIMTEKELGIKK